jgi:Sulfotransferase domain
MRILGVGLSKTGTTSLHRALGMLGFKSLHFDDERLNDVIDGTNRTPDFRRYDDVDAVLDIPAACFFEELMYAYPECRCILTVRDEDQWWRSIESHFGRSPVANRSVNPFKWDLRHYVYGSTLPREFLFRKKYREHNARVASRIPAERLLTIDITKCDGWKELCPFLGVPIPAFAFPHQNRRDENSNEYRDLTVDELTQLVPSGTTFILVDECALDVSLFPGRTAVPFLERDGVYWGAPADDKTAIRECERLRQAGARLLVVAYTAFWWLDHYAEFHQYLRKSYRCVRENDRLVAFHLGGV